ncbi:MAG: ankyrin repeat domain-containing protein, partial [Lewinella sp.]
ARINEEREHCCDDLAIEVTGEAVGYAKTLLRMKEEELKTDGVLAMAFRGQEAGGFNYRIRRLVSGYLNGATYGEGLVTALILVAALGTAVAASDGDKPGVAVNETPNLEQTSVVEDAVASTALTAETVPTSTTETDLFSSEINPMDDERKTSETEGAYADWTAINGKRIKSGSPLVLPDSLEFPFLMEAAEEGNYKLVEYFLTKNINLNQTDRNGWTPLMVATSEDHVKVVRLLIDGGADVNFVNRRGWTALIEAADEGATGSARVLLAAGAKTDLPGNSISAADMAASEGHPDILRLLAENGADLTGKGRRTSPMHMAAAEGKLSVIRNLLESGLAIDVKNESGRTPLSYAAEEGSIEVVNYLLRNGANVDVKDNYGRDAMSYAAEEGKIDVLRMLKSKGGKVMSGDEKGMTPLHYAAEEGNTNVLRAILKSGTDPDVRTRNGHTPLHYAVAEDELEVIRLLLDAGADVNAKDAKDRRVLLYASEDLMDEYHPNGGSQWNNGPREANWEVIGTLIKAGAISGSINGKRETLLVIDGEEGTIYLSEDGEELIFQASGVRGSRRSWSHTIDGSSSSHHDVFEDGTNSHHDSFGDENEVNQANEANKANERNPSNSRNVRRNVSVNNNHGNVSSGEPLVSAVRNGENRKIDLLINGGANVDGIGRNGRTPLTEASFHNYNIHTAQLVKGGADINKRDANGYTPLTMAVEHNHFSTVEHLLELGANPDLKDRNGTSAKSLALRDNYPKILRLLNEAGGSVTAVDHDGTSPLSIPAREGNLEILQYLLEQGADPNGGDGCTPIFLAAREGHPEAIFLLARYKANLEKGCYYRDTDFYYREVPGGGGSVADYRGAGPLMVALTQVNEETVFAMLEAGVNVNATCRKARYNSSRKISWRESENLRKEELASRFDTQYDVSGWTPLMEAVESGKLELVQLLLKAGADKNLVAGGGLSAKNLAATLGDPDIIAALR